VIAAPILVGSHNGPWPLHDTTASRAAEAAALATHATGALMARAGLSAARLVLARWPRARKVLVLAGPGNNGGDGWVLAEHLHRVGQQVDVWPVEARSSPPADARAARAAA
jgi:NAD(P)H-hydrate epimerase